MTNERRPAGNGMWHRDWLADAARRLSRWQSGRPGTPARLFRPRSPTLRLFGVARNATPIIGRLARSELPMVLRIRRPVSHDLGHPILTVQSVPSVQQASVAEEEPEEAFLPPAEDTPANAAAPSAEPSFIERAAGSVLRLFRREDPAPPESTGAPASAPHVDRVAADDTATSDGAHFDYTDDGLDEAALSFDETPEPAAPGEAPAPPQSPASPSVQREADAEAPEPPQRRSGIGGLFLSLRRVARRESEAEGPLDKQPPAAAKQPVTYQPVSGPPPALDLSQPESAAAPAQAGPVQRVETPRQVEQPSVQDIAPKMELRRSVGPVNATPIMREEAIPPDEDQAPQSGGQQAADTPPDVQVAAASANIAQPETLSGAASTPALEEPGLARSAAASAPGAERHAEASGDTILRRDEPDTDVPASRPAFVNRALAFLQRRSGRTLHREADQPAVAAQARGLAQSTEPDPPASRSEGAPPLNLELRHRPPEAASAQDPGARATSFDRPGVEEVAMLPGSDSALLHHAPPAPMERPPLVYRASRPAAPAGTPSFPGAAIANGGHAASNGFGEWSPDPAHGGLPGAQAEMIGRSISIQRATEPEAATAPALATETPAAGQATAAGSAAPPVPLEALAQQVYERLRQRLLLERERAGFQTVSW